MPAQDLTVEGVDYKYLSMNYILVPETEDAADNAMVEVVMTVDGHKSPIKLSNVPVKENYRTNVVGNLLSSTADFNIIVDEEYAGETNYDMLQLILANGGTYKLTGDIEISEALVAKADVILDLNGYSIKSTAGIYVPGQVVALICADGEGVDLIIEDSSADQSGVVDAVAFEDYAVEARNGATLTIKGGNFKGDITAIQAYNGSVVNIYGGVFEATPYNSTYWVLNIAQPAGSVDSEMNVYGGQFKNFNPSAPKVDSPDLSYVPEGYMVNQAGEMYIVSKTPVIENGVAEISDLGGLLWLQDMVISGNVMSDVTVKLTQDVDLNGIEWNPIGDYGATNNRFAGTFDGQGHVISNLDTYHYSSAGLFGGVTSTAIIKNVTLKDVNINSNRYTGGIVAYCSGGNAQILNCHVEGGTITSVPHVSGSSYNDGDKVGGIAGHFTGTIDGCSVKGVTITAYRDLGGICGRAAYAAVVVTNNHVENVSIVQDNTNAYKNGVQTTYGEICGDFKGSAENYTGNTFVNVTLSSVN